MAHVSEHASGEITSASEGEVQLTFCSTSESQSNKLIVRSQMRGLGEVGLLPIAIARFDLNCPGQIFLFAMSRLSQDLRVALEQQGGELIGIALNSVVLGQDIPQVSN
jgi:hypothetical protein